MEIHREKQNAARLRLAASNLLPDVEQHGPATYDGSVVAFIQAELSTGAIRRGLASFGPWIAKQRSTAP